MSDWRVEALDLSTGLRKRILPYASFDFEEKLNEVGQGSLSLNVREVGISDVWPHTTSLAFLRTAGPGATPSAPQCEFIGLVEEINPSSSGTLSIGFKSIEQYLLYRMLHGDTTFTGISQTEIAAALVTLAASQGIPLVGVAAASSILRDRTYSATDWKKIGEAIQQLTEVIDGPDYELIHTQMTSGAWMTQMRFADEISNCPPDSESFTPPPLNVRRGVIGYDLAVNGSDHANRVIGIGSTADLVYDADESTLSIYPLFERSESYTDVTLINTVQDAAQGSVLQSRHPTAIPSVTLAGLDVIAPQKVGNYVRLTMSHGAIQYDGVARIVGIAWSKSDDSPTTATLSLSPQDDVADAILYAKPLTSGCCGPAPTEPPGPDA